MRAAVLTVSDGVHEGSRQDASGETLAGLLAEEGFDVVQIGRASCRERVL